MATEACEGCGGQRLLWETLCPACVARLPRALRRRFERALSKAEVKAPVRAVQVANQTAWRGVQREALRFLGSWEDLPVKARARSPRLPLGILSMAAFSGAVLAPPAKGPPTAPPLD